MKAYIFLIFILTVVQNTFSQIKIIDNRSGEPIAFVYIIVESGKLAATSNLEGDVLLSDIENSTENKNSSILLQHVAYNNLYLTLDDLKKKSTIKMTERVVPLNEVTIRPQKKYAYIVLKGYYRSYQLDNSIPKYFTDGVVEYYLPLRGNNFKYRLLEFRSYRNQSLLDQQKLRTTTVTMKLAGVPYIKPGALISELNAKYTLKDVRSGCKEIFKENSKVGTISNLTNNQRIQIDIDKIAPKKEEVHSMFGYTSRIRNIDITENYFGSSFDEVDASQLESRKEYRKIFFKHKKDKEETLIEGIHEFYTFEIQYVSKSETKKIKLSSDTSLREGHSYSRNYWEDLEKYSIPPISKQIESEFSKSLTMY